MNALVVNKLVKNFDELVQKKDGVEFWFARDLQKLLGYTEWRKFVGVIDRAKEACRNSNFNIADHFVGAAKMVDLGSDSKREIEDILLTRYACYLVAQNGDPRKDEIAFAQSYFAVQTRKQELVEQRIALHERLNARNKLTDSETELSKLIYERGIDDKGFARIRSRGDEALFGGNDTVKMKTKLSVPKNRPLADFLPTVTIAAKNLAVELTNFNVKQNSLAGEPIITGEHVKNNKEMRNVLKKNNIVPENLPPEEDLKRLERKAKNEQKFISKNRVVEK
jgi:DNA-damage-inducible protein D